MSNIINFNAQEFKFDKDCESAGSRMFISDFDGENVQVIEIGDWQWTWSQIKCSKQLEPNTDYVFRFAVQGGVNHTGDGQSRFIIGQDNNWEDKLEYPLERSRFKPTLSKKSKDGLLRVYEIPFNSGESGMVTFIFNAHHFVETIMPAKELETYAELEDQSYDQWWQEVQERFGNMNGSKDNGNCGYLNLSGAMINRKMIEKFMDLAEKGGYVNLSGTVLGDGDDDENEYDQKVAEVDAKAEEYDRLAAEADAKSEEYDRLAAEAGDYVMVREKLKESYEHTKWLYESAPDGSSAKNALKASLDSLKSGLDGLIDAFE